MQTKVDDELDEFQTSFREIMKYIKYSADGNELKKAVTSDARFKNVECQAVDVINAATGSKVNYAGKEDKVDMCQAIQEIKEEGRLEGEMEGAITFACDLGIPKDEIKKSFMMKYKKNDEETEALFHMYWK